ncbi:hypothetical protein BH10ACT11_BH10ACT11_19140 [soil metagenome]
MLPGRIRWLGAAEPPNVAALTASGPLLVHFFDFAQLNSVRALPYVLAWNGRYAEHGLSVLGVHSPRFPFTSAGLEAGLAELGVTHPVADDAQYSIWHDYGCEGWPCLFLWGRGGALRWFHFGEGEYSATEEAIAEELLAEDITLQLPDPLAPIRPSDVPGALVMPPTEELFPGGSSAKPWQPSPGDSRLEITYEAGGAWVVADGEGELRWWVDGEGPANSSVGPRALINLTENGRHQEHSLRIEADSGVRIWAISFEPGTP